MKRITIILIIALFFACKTPKPTAQVSVETRTTVTERLVPVPVPADSAVLTALFECDSSYNVLLKNYAEIKTQRMESEFSFSNNLLNYKTIKPADSIRVVEQTVEVEKEVPVKVPVPYEVNIITGWQWFQIWTGRILGGLFCIWLIFKILRKWK
jgi:hypothetical protein